MTQNNANQKKKTKSNKRESKLQISCIKQKYESNETARGTT